MSPTTAVEAAKVAMALELVADIRRVDAQIADMKRRIRDAVIASKTVARRALRGRADRRVPGDRLHRRRDTVREPGPLPGLQRHRADRVSSAGRVVHRLSRRGNRTLNYAIHMAAVAQIRHLDSEGRAFFDRKIADGKTKREALRALKRRVSDAVHRQLLVDAERRGA